MTDLIVYGAVGLAFVILVFVVDRHERRRNSDQAGEQRRP